MATNTRALRSTAHTRAIPVSCSQLSTATAFFQIDSLQGSHLLVSLSPSLSHTQPTKQKPHSATLGHTQHSSCDRPTINNSTTKLAEKQCYPNTKDLGTVVGEFFAHDSRSFTASKKNGGNQKTYFCSGKEEAGCDALLDCSGSENFQYFSRSCLSEAGAA